MSLKYLVPLGAALVLVLTGCTPPDIQAVWPESRPLGKDIPSYRPPPGVPDPAPPAQAFTNPTGVLTLPSAGTGPVAAPTAGGLWLGSPGWGGAHAPGQSTPESRGGDRGRELRGVRRVTGFSEHGNHDPSEPAH